MESNKESHDERPSPEIRYQDEKNKCDSIDIIKVEDIYEQLGGFSKFQFFATVVILALDIPGAMVALSPILTTTNQVDFYCETQNSSTLLTKDGLCFVEKCNGTITGKQPFESIVQEWNLVCEKSWISDSLTSLFMVGSGLGPLITALIADKFGRKFAFFFVCIFLGASGIFASLTTRLPLLGNITISHLAPPTNHPHGGEVVTTLYEKCFIYWYAVSKIISGIAAGGCMVAQMNYLMEFLTPSWRIICGCVSMWPVGEMLLALAGYLYPHWRTLSWISVLPAFLLILTYPLLLESPRWLLCRNRTKAAGKVLNTIAKWNNRPEINVETLRKLQNSILAVENSEGQTFGANRWETFRNKKNLIAICIFVFAWFANGLVYYGITFNMKNMSGNQYINIFLLGMLDLPSELSGMYFSNRFGRKASFISFLAVSILCLISVAGMEIFSTVENPNAHFGMLILTLCLIGRFFNGTSFSIMVCFTGETFPTVIRSVCFSISHIASSLGGVLAPQLAYLGSFWPSGPYLLFCGICTISCMISLKLDETRQKPLHDVH